MVVTLKNRTEAPLTPISDKHVEDEDDRDEVSRNRILR